MLVMPHAFSCLELHAEYMSIIYENSLFLGFFGAIINFSCFCVSVYYPWVKNNFPLQFDALGIQYILTAPLPPPKCIYVNLKLSMNISLRRKLVFTNNARTMQTILHLNKQRKYSYFQRGTLWQLKLCCLWRTAKKCTKVQSHCFAN